MSASAMSHPLWCKCVRCTSDPATEAAYNEAVYELSRRAAPIRDYYTKLLAWGGGGALPKEPSAGEKLDFITAVNNYEAALAARQRARLAGLGYNVETPK